ncbi:Ent-kaurene oxidase [Colletotrichum orbiculare MAFF 240422]|uniref:Ent-kaurene oxidase n=1 Tax=Colletotrichum orbiculare (strain 104-T / ATCC 96160 / CBS 514.97 / LARS 414 / MAFF 240422) TaxID=1213857 RepID=N4VS85_COLOR|nr:Ent-kaurene oxidase [Colletotrichum orbiculare MAFF 240422]
MSSSQQPSHLLEFFAQKRLSHALSTINDSTNSVLIALLGAALAAVLLLCPKSTAQKYVENVPVIGGCDGDSIKKNRARFVHDSKSMLLEGYRQTNRGMYYVPSKLGERLMLPVKYLEDLKSAPVDEVDFVATFIEMFEGKYTTMGSRSTLHPRVVRGQLNRNLWTVMDHIQEEIKDAFDDSFPPCKDWTEVDVVDRMTQIVARVSSRMFGGTTLSRNKEWIQSSIDFAMDGFIGAQALKKYPEFLKPLVARFTPAIRNIKNHYDAAERAAMPLLRERAASGAAAPDLLCWMAEDANGDEKDPAFLAGILLKVSFAAIHTSAAAPTQLLYDLCDMPEYIEPLRREMEANVDERGFLGRQGFQGLSKLDSIMKESQRFNPLLLITFERVITKDYTLPDGLTIPANTTIGVPAHAISMDPEIFPEPEKFNGFRFDEMTSTTSHDSPREKAEPSVAFAAAHPASMAFGYGRHACPGRFFASAEIKAIIVHLLMNYDFKFPKGQAERPPSLVFETQNLPNPAGRIMFKRR